jgi:hypothetical protein
LAKSIVQVLGDIIFMFSCFIAKSETAYAFLEILKVKRSVPKRAICFIVDECHAPLLRRKPVAVSFYVES